jgi:hypothetical protein
MTALSQELAKAGPWSVDPANLPSQHTDLSAWREAILKHKDTDWPEHLIRKVTSVTEASHVVRTGTWRAGTCTIDKPNMPLPTCLL